jgi:hypothetical protein
MDCVLVVLYDHNDITFCATDSWYFSGRGGVGDVRGFLIT